jgi:hypothetical protein
MRDHEGIDRPLRPAPPDIALLEARMILSGQKDAARAYLAEAKRWIDRGWKVHAGESAELTALRASKPAQAVTGTLAASAINPTPKRPLVATVWLIIPNQRPAPIA